MKILFLSLLLTFNVMAADTALLISHYSDKAELTNHIELTKGIFKKLPLGDSLTVISDGEVITILEVPQEQIYASSKARMKLRRKEVGLLNKFKGQAKGSGKRPMALDVPKTFDDIGLYQSHVTDVVIIGSPRYATSYTSLDMRDNLIVRDGVFLAGRGDSPFSIQGRETLLKGKRIHWLLPASESQNGSLYSDALLRFWGAYITQMGGSLVTFSTSKDVVLKRLFNNAKPLNVAFELDRSGKAGLENVRDVSSAAMFQQVASQSPSVIRNFKQRLTIGIQWDAKGAVDLDLWAKPVDDQALHYDLQNTAYGVHYKDIRDGQKAAYETIEFTKKEVDMRSLIILVNVYHADKSQPVSGSLRVQFDGNIYDVPFSFAAGKGNKGQDVKPLLASGGESMYTKRFSVMDIVGVAI